MLLVKAFVKAFVMLNFKSIIIRDIKIIILKLIILKALRLIFECFCLYPTAFTMIGQIFLSKECKSGSDAAEHSISSGSTLFAFHPAILDTSTDCEMDLV